MPDDIRQEIIKGRVRNYEKGYIWFNVKDTAAYKIENGKEITIEPYKEANLEDIKLYLLGSCLGIVLIENNKLPIHGGSININNKGVIFMGDKGAGKSTLTSALRLKGYKLIADDISVIEKENKYKIMNGYPRQKLCEDTVKKLGYKKEDFKSLIVDNKLKYVIPAEDKFNEECTTLNIIYYLSVGDVNEVKVTEMRGKEKLDKLIENIYRIEVLRAIGIQGEHIKQYVDILRQIPMYNMERPRNCFSIDKQIKLIEEKVI